MAQGRLKAAGPRTLAEAADEFLEAAERGAVLTRSGRRYKPSTVRGYRQAFDARVRPQLGGSRLGALRHVDMQRLADRLSASGLDGATVRNAMTVLRTIFRRALVSGDVAVNPVSGILLPAPGSRRERVAGPQEAAALVAALPERDRAVWATALYGGLRRGELLALRWRDVDDARGLLHVRDSYDVRARQHVGPKTHAGIRSVPIVAVLGEHLARHRAACRWAEEESGYVFGRSPTLPFHPDTLRERALRAWRKAALTPITLHECRHTAASLFIEAGAGLERTSSYLGHASITITADRYRHLLPDAADAFRAAVDGYLSRAGAPQDLGAN